MILIFITIFIKIIISQGSPPSKGDFANFDFSSRGGHISSSGFPKRNSIIHRKLINNMDIFVYSNGTTIVVGEGEMNNYSSTTSPFYPYWQTMIAVKIDDRIRSLGSFSFFGCDDFTKNCFWHQFAYNLWICIYKLFQSTKYCFWKWIYKMFHEFICQKNVSSEQSPFQRRRIHILSQNIWIYQKSKF